MEIITAEDLTFPEIQLCIQRGKVIGTYWREGGARKVYASKGRLVISLTDDPNRVGVINVKNFAEAESLALKLLFRERRRGNTVNLERDYLSDEP